MPTVKLCAVCNGHGSSNYTLSAPFKVATPAGVRMSSVNAANIDLCDDCWTRLTNKRTLTLQGVKQRIEKRRAAIVALANGEEILLHQ